MKRNFLSRKEEIVLTTVSLIHEIGVHNISMKEIGRREGVSEASLYKHFSSKEELLTHVIEYYEKFDRNIYLTSESDNSGSKEAILKFFVLYAEYYNNDKEIISLRRVYDILGNNISFAERAKMVTEQKTRIIVNLIEKAQAKEELAKDAVPENLAYILLGSFDRVIDMWVLKEYSFSLKDKTEEIISSILDVYSVKSK